MNTRLCRIIAACATCAVAAVGCGGDARVDLSAADALTAVAGQMRIALDEYHAEVDRHDESREASVVEAFVARVRRDAQDEHKLDEHAGQFGASLAKIREDRKTEWTRRNAAESQVEAVLELSRGLRRIGIEGLALQDEMRRYLRTWMDAKSKAAQPDAGAAASKGAQ
jgi:hypothetical protein